VSAMVKRYNGQLAIYTDQGVEEFLNGTFVAAADYDAMDSAATALGIHVQHCESRIAALEAALTKLGTLTAGKWWRAPTIIQAALAPESPKGG